MKLYVPKGYRWQTLGERLRFEESGGLWTPPHSLSRYELGPSTYNSTITITADSSAHTKGAYSEIIASTAFDACCIEVHVSGVGGGSVDSSLLLDIAIGGAGSETVIIPNLNAGAAAGSANRLSTKMWRFPLYVPAGSRLSGRCQGVIASDTVLVWVRLLGGPTTPVWFGDAVTDYGTNLATSQGVTVTPGSGSEGSWTQIVASTSLPHWFLSAGPAISGTSVGNWPLELDIAIGAATEVALTEGWKFELGSTSSITQDVPVEVWAPVPAGSRLSVRMQSGSTTARDCILYGV